MGILYNSYGQNSLVEKNILALEMPAAVQVEKIDMTKIFNWAAHDIYVHEDSAQIYHNEGDYDLDTDTASVSRVKGAEFKIWS
jgi:hypothetical protein